MSIQSPSGVPRELPLSGMGRFSPNFGVIEHTSRCGALWQASAHKGLLGVAPVHRRAGSCGGLVPRSASQVADWLCMHVGGGRRTSLSKRPGRASLGGRPAYPSCSTHGVGTTRKRASFDRAPHEPFAQHSHIGPCVGIMVSLS